jgi:hypothetical protein
LIGSSRQLTAPARLGASGGGLRRATWKNRAALVDRADSAIHATQHVFLQASPEISGWRVV